MVNNVGRPLEVGRTRGSAMCIYLDPEGVKLLDEIRWREHKSRSELVRRAIEDYLKTHGSGNDTYKLDNWKEDPDFQAVPAYYTDIETWINHYRNANEKDRTQLRIRAIELQKKFKMVDINP